MTTIKPNFTILKSGIDPAIAVLKARLSITDIDDDELRAVKSVRVVGSELGGKNYEFDKDNSVLRVSSTRREVIEAIKSELDLSHTPENKLYASGETLKDEQAGETPIELNPEEERSRASLEVLSELLDRAYNRRTTLTSWILYSVFQSFGLKEDEFGPMANSMKDPNFAKVFTNYRKLAEENKSEAEKYLASAFEKKDGDETSCLAKQKLIKTASFLIDNYNKLNMDFVKMFPKIFCLQNMAMPFLKWLCPKTKLFDFMVTINPWIYDLVSENLGNYVGEIQKIQEISTNKEKRGEKVLCEVNLTPLTFEEFSLQKIIKNINSGFDRIFGKESTISSIIVNRILERTPYKTYKAFAKQFTDDTRDEGFIKQLYAGLMEASTDGKAPEEKFEKGTAEHWVTKIICGITSVARSVPAETIKRFSNIFGAIFVPLNLTMPLLAKVFDKGFLGFVTHSMLKVFPILNELVFDHFANFRKEILDVQKETSNESIEKLFPEIKFKSTYDAFTTHLRSLYDSIIGFTNRFSKKRAAA